MPHELHTMPPDPNSIDRDCPFVSVVVAVRGNAALLPGLLRCLAGQAFPTGHMEVVLVDNHARPVLSEALLEPAGVPGVVVSEPQAGLSRARNAGIRHARGEYLVFTDPDSRPETTWILHLVTALRDTDAYCAGGRLIARYTGPGRPRWDDGVRQLFVPPSWPERTSRLQAPYWLAGCNLAVRRDPLPVFNEHLGACGRRHLSCEDLELVIRAQHEGNTVIVVPEAVVHRAIHPTDLRLTAVLARAFWHGVSIARLCRQHPAAEIYDSSHLRHALPVLFSSRWRAGLAGIARVLGLRSESARLARYTGHGSDHQEVPEVLAR